MAIKACPSCVLSIFDERHSDLERDPSEKAGISASRHFSTRGNWYTSSHLASILLPFFTKQRTVSRPIITRKCFIHTH